MKRAILYSIVVMALSACTEPYWECDGSETYCADGIPVYLEAGFPENYYNDPTFEARLAAQIAVSLQMWGVSHNELEGYKIIMAVGMVTCDGSVAWGCCDFEEKTISVEAFSPGWAPGCIEYSILPHELGHLHDDYHEDARWCSDWEGPIELMMSQPECAPLADITSIDYEPVRMLRPPSCRYQ